MDKIFYLKILGFIVSLIFISSINYVLCQNPLIYDYTKDPIYKRDDRFLEQALREKQMKLDIRRKEIYTKGYQLDKLFSRLSEKNNGLTKSQTDYYNSFIKAINSYLQSDLTINNNYYNAMTMLNDVENQIFKWL